MSEVFTVYTKPNCPYCIRAKKLLSNKGMSYVEKEVGKDVTKEELIEAILSIQENAVVKTVPQITQGQEYIGGFMELESKLQ